jgi:hypothetical protein
MTDNAVDVLFIHHSVGRGVLVHGAVRKRMAQQQRAIPVRLWDHDYNWRGLRGPDGRRHGKAFPVLDDNTYPDGLLHFFEAASEDPSLREQLSRYDAIIMKSCFPNSRIESDEDFALMQERYRSIAEHVTSLGIVPAIVTSPPVRAGRIDPAVARRAAGMAEWLMTEGPFVHRFDLFSLLAETDRGMETYGMLASENANLLWIDSHPKIRASRRIGKPFAAFVQEVGEAVAAEKSTSPGHVQ